MSRMHLNNLNMIGILHMPYSDYAYFEYDLNLIKAIGEWCLHGSVIF